jgi:hypothetical protein
MTEWCTCNKLKEAEEKAAKWDAIVRCGECKYLMRGLPYKGRFACFNRGLFVTEKDFCSWGERRNDAG